MNNQLYKNSDERPFSYLFQPRLSQLVVYYEHARSVSKCQHFEPNRKANLKGRSTYAGEISKSGQKAMRKAIECLYVVTPRRKVYNRVLAKETNFHLSILTLTLSYLQGPWLDKDISKFCLAPFILDCKRKLGLQNYVWKAERQQNGNLHYHIISDLYADQDVIRKFWNDKQDTLGFIDKFYARFNHRQPPSIKIQYVRNVDELGKYISKYISKSKGKHKKDISALTLYPVQLYFNEPKNQTLYKEMENRRWEFVNGRVWDCSVALKSFKYNAVDLSTVDRDSVTSVCALFQKNKFDGDYFSVINFKNENYIRHMPVRLQQSFIDQYRKVIDENTAYHMQRRLLS
jgi:hypothetical protein